METFRSESDTIKQCKFGANISSMFMDIPDHIESFLEILKRKDYHFESIEAQDPYKNSIEEWEKLYAREDSDTFPEFTLINSVNLIEKYVDRIPNEEEFENDLETLAKYCAVLKVRKVHLILFKILNDSNGIEIAKQYLRKGAEFLNTYNIVCLIEPLSTVPNYYLRSYDQALSLVRELNVSNLKIMFDLFHCQKLHGNLCHYMDLLKNHIGHVQVSQVPYRDCPLNEGELQYSYLFKKLSTIYDDYIGLEYFNSANDSLDWITEFSSKKEKENNSK
ncbi:hypothetical protein NH340_JMT08794 [Sarcoptes scabiei]|nr:serine/threonine-protein kinase haspin [Sarcoptes scabiei]UXI22851.1 hypothetical protein NH340_JMT08794 [Sarcoptes scabiei]